MGLHPIMRGVWEAGIVVIVVLGSLASCASALPGRVPAVCERQSIEESVLGSRDNYCPLDSLSDSTEFVRIAEVAHGFFCLN